MTNPEEVLASIRSDWETRIRDMEPGRELDALVAEKVMGWKIRRTTVLAYGSNPLATFRTLYTVTDGRGIDWSPTYDLDGVGLPRYSTDISAAFEVVEKIKGRRICIEKTLSGSFYCVIGHSDDGHKPADYQAQTAPEAICKAALLAVMEK